MYAGRVVAKAYPDRTVTSPILEEMLTASPGDKKSMMKFWSSDKRSKSQPNPAVEALIAKHVAHPPALDGEPFLELRMRVLRRGRSSRPCPSSTRCRR